MKKFATLLIVLLSSSVIYGGYSVSIHREYMGLRKDGDEWRTDVIADLKYNGESVTNIENFYFEFRTVFGSDDNETNQNSMGQNHIGIDEDLGDYLDIYLKVHDGDRNAPTIAVSNTLEDVGMDGPSIPIYIQQANNSGYDFIDNESLVKTWIDRAPMPDTPGESGKFWDRAMSGGLYGLFQLYVKSEDLVYLQADPQIQYGHKFNHWDDPSTIINFNLFIFEESGDQIGVSYAKVADATITTIPDAEILGEDLLEVSDPWLRDDLSSEKGPRNQGMDAPFKPLSSGDGNLGINTNHLGVILNQNDQFDPALPIYRLRVPATAQADETDWYFQQWDGTDVTFQHSDQRTSSVVFRHADATAEAVYKGHFRSDTPLATAYSNGRKVTVNTGVDQNGQTFTQYNTVYTDHSEIYLAAVRQYADGSITEYPETRVSEGTGNNGAPAIATLVSGGYGIIDVVVWTRIVENQSDIVYSYLLTDYSGDFQPVPISGMLGESSSPALVATVSSTDVRPAVIGWTEGAGKAQKSPGPDTPQTKGIIITWRDDAHHLKVWTKFDQGDEPLYTIAESGTGLGHPAIGIPDRNGNEPFFITYAVDGQIHLRRLVAPANLSGDSPTWDRKVTDNLEYLSENADPQLAFGLIDYNTQNRAVFVTWTGVKDYEKRFALLQGMLKPPGPGIEPDIRPVRTTWVRPTIEQPGPSYSLGKPYNLLYWPDDPNGNYPHAATRPQIAGLDLQKTVVWRDADTGNLRTQTFFGDATTDEYDFDPVTTVNGAGRHPALAIRLAGSQTTTFWTQPQYTPVRITYASIGSAPAGRALHRVASVSGSDSIGIAVPYGYLDFQHSELPPPFRHGSLHAELWPARVQHDTTVTLLPWYAAPDTASTLIGRTDPVSPAGLTAMQLSMQLYGMGFSQDLPDNPHRFYQVTLWDQATHEPLETLWSLSWRTLRAQITETNNGEMQFIDPVQTIVELPTTDADSVYFTCEIPQNHWSVSPQTGVLVFSGEGLNFTGNSNALLVPAPSANGGALAAGAYPNPFNPTTTISYTLPKSAQVTLTIYDLTGREVKTLVHARQASGDYAVQWTGRNQYGHPVSSGMYFYRLQAANAVKTHKILLVR